MRTSVMAVLLVAMTGCQEQRDDAQQAVEAAKAVMELAKEGKRAGEAAEAAEKAAREQMPEGTDPEQAKQQIELAKSIAAMKAMGAGGPAVNWRQLAAFLPEKIGAYAAKGELKGSTKKAAGFEFSEVERSYDAGPSRVRVKITDASTTPFLRAPFAMAAMVSEDSTEGYKKGKTLGGHTAIVEWREKSKASSAVLLVAQRFVVDLRVNDADKPTAAETLVTQLDLDKLAGLKAEEAEAAEAATATN